jgi:hypothetical protein
MGPGAADATEIIAIARRVGAPMSTCAAMRCKHAPSRMGYGRRSQGTLCIMTDPSAPVLTYFWNSPFLSQKRRQGIICLTVLFLRRRQRNSAAQRCDNATLRVMVAFPHGRAHGDGAGDDATLFRVSAAPLRATKASATPVRRLPPFRASRISFWNDDF